MYRIVSSILLLVGIAVAIAFSVIFLSSRDFSHLKVAVGLWFGVAWYLGFQKKRKRASNSHAVSQPISHENEHEPIDVSITLPVAFGTFFVLFGPYVFFKLIGWDSVPGTNFLAACFGGMGALVFLVLVSIFRSFKKPRKK